MDVDFNSLPNATQEILAIVREQSRQIAELKAMVVAQSQSVATSETLVLGTWHEWEIIYTSDERLKNFGIKRSQVQHWKEIGLPFHYTASGGKLYTTPRELEAYLNPHREALKSATMKGILK